MKKILINGQKNFSNRGCEALIRSIVKLIKNKFPDAKIFIPSSNPLLDKRQFDDPSIIFIPYYYPLALRVWTQLLRLPIPLIKKINFPLFLPSKIEKTIDESDIVISLGGDMYTYEDRIPSWIHAFDNIAITKKKPIHLVSASLSDFSEVPTYQRFLKAHFSKFDNIIVREDISFDIVKRIFDCKNINKIPDIAFIMEKEAIKDKNFWSSNNSEKIVGINMSPLVEKLSHKINVKEIMKNFINYLIIDKKMKVLLIPHVFELSNINQNDDLSYLSSIKSELGNYNGNLEIINNQYNAAEIKYIISKCSFFLGARMHSTIAAISTNVPTIFLTYSNKGIGMSKFIYDNLPLFIPMNDLNLELIKSKFELLENNESSIRATLKNKIPEIITTVEKGYSKIFN